MPTSYLPGLDSGAYCLLLECRTAIIAQRYIEAPGTTLRSL